MAIGKIGSTNSFEARQEALSATASVVAAYRPHRYRVTIQNTEDADGIVVYVGHNEDVGPSTGLPLSGQQSVSIYTAAPVWMEAASGTPTVAILEEFEA